MPIADSTTLLAALLSVAGRPALTLLGVIVSIMSFYLNLTKPYSSCKSTNYFRYFAHI